jgi:uroporphyrinogen-III synthase
MMAPRLVVTLSEGALAGLDDALASRGLAAERVPLLRAGVPASWDPVDVALAQLAHYHAVAVTSPRAATALADRAALRHVGLAATPAWAVGERTAVPLRRAFGDVRVVRAAPGADVGAAETLADAMLSAGVSGAVLFACGDLHRDALPRRLGEAGCRVDEVCCYRSELVDAAEALRLVGGATLLVVGSPSVLEVLARALPADARPLLVALGPTTAAAGHAVGWSPDAVAQLPDADAVAEACATLLAAERILP